MALAGGGATIRYNRRMRRLVLSCVLAFPVLAQDAAASLTWQLPARGAAEYQRTTSAKTVTAPTRPAATVAEAKADVPVTFLPRLLPAPWLCQGELAADQRAVGDEPRDLRDVLRAVGFDLRLKGTTKLRYARIVPFGDLLLQGKVDPAAADEGPQRSNSRSRPRTPNCVPASPRRCCSVLSGRFASTPLRAHCAANATSMP